MANELKGKVAVVTGSTSGIGQGIAEALARAGAGIMLNGFGDAAAIEAYRAGLEKDCKVAVDYHSADMSKPAEIAAMMKRAADKLVVEIRLFLVTKEICTGVGLRILPPAFLSSQGRSCQRAPCF